MTGMAITNHRSLRGKQQTNGMRTTCTAVENTIYGLRQMTQTTSEVYRLL